MWPIDSAKLYKYQAKSEGGEVHKGVSSRKNSAHAILGAVGHITRHKADGNSHSLCTSAPYTSCTIDTLRTVEVVRVYTPECVEVFIINQDAGTKRCSSVLRRLPFIASPGGVLPSCGNRPFSAMTFKNMTADPKCPDRAVKVYPYKNLTRLEKRMLFYFGYHDDRYLAAYRTDLDSAPIATISGSHKS